MRRLSLLIACVLVSIGIVSAQVSIYQPNQKTDEHSDVSAKYYTKSKNKLVEHSFSQTRDLPSGVAFSNKSGVNYTPSLELKGSWSSFYNIETGESQMYTYSEVKEEWSITEITIQPYDNDLKPLTPIIVRDLPSPSVVSVDYERTNDYFIIFFYSPAHGDYQSWFINNKGEVVYQLATSGAFFLDGKTLMALEIEESYDPETYEPTGEAEFKIYDLPSFEARELTIPFPNIMTTPQELFAPFFDYELDGKDLFVVASVSKMLMNMEDYNPDKDCHLTIQMYDKNDNYSLYKEIDILLDSYFEPHADMESDEFEGFNVHSIIFGAQALPWEYYISKDVFNSDDKIEIVFSVSIDKMGREGSYVYYVVNEDGQLVKEFKPEGLYAQLSLNEVEGAASEMLFVLADEEGNQSLQIVDCKTFETKVDIPAYIGDDNLMVSVEIHRILENNEIVYLMAMAVENVEIGVDQYQSNGHIYKINNKLEILDDIVLDLTYDPNWMAINFDPILSLVETPLAFDPDKAIDYIYGVKYGKIEGGYMVEQTGTYIYVSKAGEKAYFAPFNNEEFASVYGETSGAGFLYDKTGSSPKYFYITGVNWDSYPDYYTTAFYALPLKVTEPESISDEITNKEAFVFVNNDNIEIRTSEEIDYVQVYSISGALVYQGTDKQIATERWNTGVYVVKAVINKQAVHTKVIIK